MEKNNTRSAKRWTTTDVTRMALVHWFICGSDAGFVCL